MLLTRMTDDSGILCIRFIDSERWSPKITTTETIFDVISKEDKKILRSIPEKLALPLIRRSMDLLREEKIMMPEDPHLRRFLGIYI